MQKKTFLLLAQNGAFVKSILVELLQILFWLASYSMYILLIVLSHLINSRAIMYIDVVLCLDGLLWVLTLYFGVLYVNQISCCKHIIHLYYNLCVLLVKNKIFKLTRQLSCICFNLLHEIALRNNIHYHVYYKYIYKKI